VRRLKFDLVLWVGPAAFLDIGSTLEVDSMKQEDAVRIHSESLVLPSALDLHVDGDRLFDNACEQPRSCVLDQVIYKITIRA
jgi:hypothetical protein